MEGFITPYGEMKDNKSQLTTKDTYVMSNALPSKGPQLGESNRSVVMPNEMRMASIPQLAVQVLVLVVEFVS
jgi:DNA/RNA endonuclease G (NUC1)